ncbi:hypothetical protein ABG067_007115 [Albugo candida]
MRPHINASQFALLHRNAVAITPHARVLSTKSKKAHPTKRFFTDFRFREYVQNDFKSWIQGEVIFISLFLICGITGVYIYKNRENTPVKRVQKLFSHAKECADRDERQKALHDCLQGLSIIRETNPQDRHLFSVSFGIAAQYETLGNRYAAIRHYLEALQSIDFLSDSNEKMKNKVVAMDRIAQCYEELNEFPAAEKYYRQAFQLYESLSKTTLDLDQQISGLVYNYGHFLWKRGRSEEAQQVLLRAKDLATKADLAREYVEKIQNTLETVREEQIQNGKAS